MLNVVKDWHVSLIRRGSYFENALLPYITHSLLERKLCIDQLLTNIWTGILEWWKIIDIFYLIMILQTINIYLVHLICIVKWIAKYHPTIFISIFDLSEMLQFPSVLSTCLLSGVKISKFSCVIYLPLGDMVQWNSVTNIVYSQLPKWTWEMLDLALKGVYFKWSKPLLTSIISN